MTLQHGTPEKAAKHANIQYEKRQLHNSGYGLKRFYQTIFSHFKIKTDACWLPHRMRHWVKSAGKSVGEKCWPFSKCSDGGVRSAVTGHPSSTIPSPISLVNPKLEHRKHRGQMITVTLHPDDQASHLDLTGGQGIDQTLQTISVNYF